MMIGRRISNYEILSELGQGGMGTVYKAKDTKLDRFVALKFLPPNLSGLDEEKKRFIREAKAASSLDHPNICSIYQIDETEDGQMFIAMACYDGESLRTKIDRGKITIEEAINIAIQIAQGLEKAHSRNIVHRDIKPANVLITEDLQIKLVDFGLAKLTGRTLLTKEGTTLGTVAYMSPEQTQGNEVDPRTDIWALGVILYEMLAGRRPFMGDYEQAVIYSIVNEDPTSLRRINPEVPAEIERIVERALKKDRNARFASVTEMLGELKQCKDWLFSQKIGTSGFQILLRGLRQPSIMIPMIGLVAMFIVGGMWLFNRNKNIQWARKIALPEIEKLVEASWRDYTEAYDLMKEAEKYIPSAPRLQELITKSSIQVNITTNPPGAAIYCKRYNTPNDVWQFLGVSPLEKIRLPIGIFRWKMEKSGYETVLAADATFGFGGQGHYIPNNLARTLDEKAALPEGMVRVSGGETPKGKLDDFFIDKYEVTNKQFKEFIDSGGYRKREFWLHEFIKNGKTLTWEQAMSEFVDLTGRPGPAGWQAGDLPKGQDTYPVSGISWYEAAAYAEFVGKSLPTETHWGVARGEYASIIRWPQLGGFAVFAPFSNFDVNGPRPVGSLPGITAYGAYDMAGNVREWCWNQTPKGRLIRGGAWSDNTYMFKKSSQAPAFDRSSQNGFRCAIYPDLKEISASFKGPVQLDEVRDFYKETPVPDPIFAVYKEQFAYDKTELNARIESSNVSENWIHERVTMDAAYGNERLIAHLFLPKNVSPPYQTVIYFPGTGPLRQQSSENIESYFEFPVFLSFIVKNGRALLFPVYKGTFERQDYALTLTIINGESSHRYTEWVIQLVKDFRKSIDYLETREEIDHNRLAYYGMSWGALMGAIIPAVEERLKVSVLISGGLLEQGRPEVNAINFVTRVKIPTLMLNGRYDTIKPFETTIKPMFDLLGTIDQHKKMKLFDADHVPPRNQFIRETLAWFDTYLGPVN